MVQIGPAGPARERGEMFKMGYFFFPFYPFLQSSGEHILVASPYIEKAKCEAIALLECCTWFDT